MIQGVPGKGNENFEQNKPSGNLEETRGNRSELKEIQEKLKVLLEMIGSLHKKQDVLKKKMDSLYEKQNMLEEKMNMLEEKMEEIENRIERLETENIFLMESISLFHSREGRTLFPKAYRISKLNAAIFEEEEERLPFRKF